jgi:hypothetical protein
VGAVRGDFLALHVEQRHEGNAHVSSRGGEFRLSSGLTITARRTCGSRILRRAPGIGFFDTSAQADESTKIASNWLREEKL